MKTPKSIRGVTLIELMTTLSVAAVVLTLGVPSFRGIQLSMQRAQVSSSLTASFTLARSEAARRAVSVTVCPSSNGTSCAGDPGTDWKSGWIVFTDVDSDGAVDSGDERLDTVRFERPVFKLDAANALGSRITFASSGFPASTGTFTYEDDQMTCGLRLSPVGRVEKDSNDPQCG